MAWCSRAIARALVVGASLSLDMGAAAQPGHPYRQVRYGGDTLMIWKRFVDLRTSGCTGQDSLILSDGGGLQAVRRSLWDPTDTVSYWRFTRSDTTVRQYTRVIRGTVLCKGEVVDSVFLWFSTLMVAPEVGRSGSGAMSLGMWRAQRGVRVRLRNYDAHGDLPVVGFTVRRRRAGEEDRVWINPGSSFVDPAGIAGGAERGDRYDFTNIRYRSADGFGVVVVSDSLVVSIR